MRQRVETPLSRLFWMARCKDGGSLRDVEAATGVSQTMVSQIERGIIKRPSFETVVLLCRYYGVSLQDAASRIEERDGAMVTA